MSNRFSLPNPFPQQEGPVSRRARARRLYYLRAVCQRMIQSGATVEGLPACFAVDEDTFDNWLAGRESAPAWIPTLAAGAYRIPEPRRGTPLALLLWILAGTVAGVLASLLLSWLL